MEKGVNLFSMRSRIDWVIFILLLAAVVTSAIGFEYTDAASKTPGFSSVPLDDSWIHFIYARSLATSLRLDYNPGKSEAGFTSMLWVIALAPLLLLQIPAPLAAKILGLLALFLVSWIIYRWLMRSCNRVIGFGGALLVAVQPIFTYAALSGMEVMVYALVMIAAAWFYYEQRYSLCAWMLALTVLARPDGLILVGMILGAFTLEKLLAKAGRLRKSRTTWQETASLFALPAIAAIAWMLFCLHATGRPVPTSFYVRAGGMGFFFGEKNLIDLFQTASGLAFTLNHFLKGILAIFGIGYFIIHKKPRGLLLFAFPLVFIPIMGTGWIQVVGGTFFGARYLIPSLPFLILLQLFGIALIVELVSKAIPNEKALRMAAPIATAVLILSLLLPFSGWHHQRQNLEREFALSCENIEDMQVRIAKWLKENTPKDAVIGIFDAGAIRYLSDRKAIDILSLNNYLIPPLNPTVIRTQVDYLVTYPVHTAEIVAPYLGNEVFEVTLENNVVCADKTMTVYEINKKPTGQLPENPGSNPN